MLFVTRMSVPSHDGSAGSMEAKGVVECFSTSGEKYNLQCTEYLGDGDSKSYKQVCEADPYGKPIKKLECIGHIQIRIGRKLRNLKDNGLFKDLHDASKVVSHRQKYEQTSKV